MRTAAAAVAASIHVGMGLLLLPHVEDYLQLSCW